MAGPANLCAFPLNVDQRKLLATRSFRRNLHEASDDPTQRLQIPLGPVRQVCPMLRLFHRFQLFSSTVQAGRWALLCHSTLNRRLWWLAGQAVAALLVAVAAVADVCRWHNGREGSTGSGQYSVSASWEGPGCRAYISGLWDGAGVVDGMGVVSTGVT